ncbi:Serine/threonine-protein kinase STY8-like protein [Drosera capensis]
MAALECWSGRSSRDDDGDMAAAVEEEEEEVLIGGTYHRSEGSTGASSSSNGKDSLATMMMYKKLQRLTRNVTQAIASIKKNSFNLLLLDSPSPSSSSSSSSSSATHKLVWGSIIRSLTQLYPGSQLPDKLVSNLRNHYDSMPFSYVQVGFSMKDVFLHIRLMEQTTVDGQPALLVENNSDDLPPASLRKVTFACHSSISCPAMSWALDNASLCCKNMQIFEKKGATVGILLLPVQPEHDKSFPTRIENVVKLASKKQRQSTMKLPFRLCGFQQENGGATEFRDIGEDSSDRSYRNGSNNLNVNLQLPLPLPSSSLTVSVDEWQTIKSGGDEDLLELMTCGHKNILQFHGLCVDEIHSLCVLTKFMEGGSVYDLLQNKKRLRMKEVMRIAIDLAEGMKFMNDHGVAYRDLNTHRILLDCHGNACLGDMGIVMVSKGIRESLDYETDGYRWQAPEIIAGDPESASETWMSNVYSFGMVIWEMVAGEAAYSAYSPVQAAVGIAMCGLRPEIPKDCPHVLKSLMTQCWDSCPSKHPQFTEVISMLMLG